MLQFLRKDWKTLKLRECLAFVVMVTALLESMIAELTQSKKYLLLVVDVGRDFWELLLLIPVKKRGG